MSVFYVFLPVYNEQEAIARLLEEIRGVLETCGVPFHLLVVDDGSTDKTPQILEDIKKGRSDTLTVLTHEQNRGIDGVFRTGLFHVASGENPEDHLIIMEADRTNDLDYLPSMVEALKEGSDLVRLVSCPRARSVGFP